MSEENNKLTTLKSSNDNRVVEALLKIDTENPSILDKVRLAMISQSPKNYLRFEDMKSFNKLLDEEPSPRIIKQHPTFRKVKYIPIRDLEVMLRELFGSFQVVNQKSALMGNAVVTTLDLMVWHPVLGEWLTYSGTGAVPIELKADRKNRTTGEIIEKGAEHSLDFEKMSRTALQRNAPASAGFAFSNACKKLGRKFGSHINSDEAELKHMGIL